MQTKVELSNEDKIKLRDGYFDTFAEADQWLERKGMDAGERRLVIVKRAPKLYNQWCQAGRPENL